MGKPRGIDLGGGGGLKVVCIPLLLLYYSELGEREVRELCMKSYNVGKEEIYWAFFIDTPKPLFLTLEGGFQGLGLTPTPPSGFTLCVCE